jgi:uncharacterized protein
MRYLYPERGARETWINKIAGTWAVLVGWMVIGGIVTAISIATVFFDSENIVHLYSSSFLNFAVLILSMQLVLKWFGRPLLSLITFRNKFDWRQYFFGFILWISILSFSTFLGYLVAPQDFIFTFELMPFLLALALLVFWLPIQTGAEELLFRGFIPQMFSNIVKNPVILLVISSLLFSAPHMLNPEAQSGITTAFFAYAIIGATFGVGSFVTGSLEIGMGAHLANNFFGLLLVGYANSAIPGNAIWTLPPANLDQSLVAGIVFLGIWYGLVRWLWPKVRKSADALEPNANPT